MKLIYSGICEEFYKNLKLGIIFYGIILYESIIV